MLKSAVIDSGQEPSRLCLEFVNTLLWHASEHPEETLHSYADLVAWAQGVRLVSNHEAQKLLGDAADRPAEARPIALSAAELLISEERERIGQCADDRDCGWLFLDNSKNRSRRWCYINDCGNRAKQRRHYERTRKHT
jgi:predicted RNA-binding Zn ribbon-like protein